MILFVQIEKLGAFLSTLSPLIDQYQQGNMAFSVNSLKWLEEAEEVMSSLRLPEGAQLATLRAGILKAGDRAEDDEGKRTRSAIRRACAAAAADALNQAEAVMRGRVQTAQDKLEHFEDKLGEALTAAALVNIIPPPSVQSREAWLKQVWQAVSQHQSIRPTTLYLSSALFAADRLYILDKILTRLFDAELPLNEVATAGSH